MSQLLLDTSCAVPLLLADAEAHSAVRQRVRGHQLGLAGHARIETYSVLTRLPREQRLPLAEAVRALEVNFPVVAQLPASVQTKALSLFAELGIQGGAAYDGLVALAAKEAGITLLTNDLRARGVYTLIGCDLELL